MDTVRNNLEKHQQYSKEYSRLNKALNLGFYLEAVAIDYAIIEDRLVAFLHYAGIVSRSNPSLKVNKQVYPYMRKLLQKGPTDNIKVKDISVKMELIRALLSLTEAEATQIDIDVAEYATTTGRTRHFVKEGYMLDLYKLVNERINKKSIITIFDDLNAWKFDRNNLIHALLNKTASSSEETKRTCAYHGYDIAREIDDMLVKPFKENNNIRRKYRIQ